MRPKIQRFFMLFLAVLLCLSGCGKKEEALTDPEDMVSSGPGYPDVAAGQSYFYYKNCYGELYAISAGNQKKTALGAGKLLGADEQYAYIWQESKLRVMDGAKQAAEFDCPETIEYGFTDAGRAFFRADDRLYTLVLSTLEWRQYQTKNAVKGMTAAGDRLFYTRYAESGLDLLLCGYDLTTQEEQILAAAGRSSTGSDVAYVDGRLYYATDTAFYCYEPVSGWAQPLLEAEQAALTLDHTENLAYVYYTKDAERRLWVYDMAAQQQRSDERAAYSVQTNAFGATFMQEDTCRFGSEGTGTSFEPFEVQSVCSFSGSPAGIILSTRPQNVYIAFKQPDGSYQTVRVAQ